MTSAPTFQDTRPAALAADGGSDPWGDFRVEEPAAIQRLLRQLADTGAPVQLSSPRGHALTVPLWSLDAARGQLGFGAAADSPPLHALVQGDEAVAVAYLDNVKLQFDLDGLMLVRGHGSCTLRARWPAVLYRFQRRAAYRVRIPERQAPGVRLRHPSIPDMHLTLRIVDIGAGGCALSLPADVPALQPGSSLRGVRIELDGDTVFTTTLKLQHVSAWHDGGVGGTRLGCEFVDLDGHAQRTLQRWIDHAQQRRRLLSLR
jgi:c-di-GMP-binding flagellar brake protein YcgR